MAHSARDPRLSHCRPIPEKVYVNAVYYANWRVYKNEPPSLLKPDVCSHLCYAFARVKPDGEIYVR